ncbi:GrpB family protein [Candidatus Wolfebacteria bacterium]|nr:GrpB family protein [Candidatus Wolfebacteria bacterium]
MLGVKRGTVVLLPYSSEWKLEFEKEKASLLKTFGDRIKAIEHIGSTAIPSIPAKPIIDMNVAVESIDDIEDFIVGLQKLGYEYIPERRYTDRQFFPKGPSECRTHHLNLVEIYSETAWKNPLLFRDYLRNNEGARKEYKKLKEELVCKYADNREEYTERKGNFVMSVVEKARIVK